MPEMTGAFPLRPDDVGLIRYYPGNCLLGRARDEFIFPPPSPPHFLHILPIILTVVAIYIKEVDSPQKECSPLLC